MLLRSLPNNRQARRAPPGRRSSPAWPCASTPAWCLAPASLPRDHHSTRGIPKAARLQPNPRPSACCRAGSISFIIQQLTDTSGELKLYGNYPPALPSSDTAVLERTTDDAQQTPAERKKRRSSWQLLAYHDFRLYFFGSLISNLGTWLQSTALVLIAYQVTNSVFMVGVITSAQFAGMILISPWAAVLVDRLSPRAVLVGSQCASAAIAAWMAWRYMVGMLGVHSLVFGALALGTCFAVALPIQTAMVPSLVGEADAKDAVKMNSVSYNAGRALAPALSVLVIATTGPRLTSSRSTRSHS